MLDAALLPDEEVLWTGRPDPVSLVAIERRWLPGGVLLLALAGWIVWRTEADWLALVVALALAGINAMTLPWRAARAAGGILYAVTDRQVRIVDLFRLDPCQAYPFTALKPQLRPGSDGERGDLVLRRRDFFPAAIEGVARQRRPVFVAIDRPGQVLAIIMAQVRRYVP